MKDPLPVPDELEKELAKCKTVRDADTFFRSRDKTKQVRVDTDCAASTSCHRCSPPNSLTSALPLAIFVLQEIEAARASYLLRFPPSSLLKKKSDSGLASNVEEILADHDVDIAAADAQETTVRSAVMSEEDDGTFVSARSRRSSRSLASPGLGGANELLPTTLEFESRIRTSRFEDEGEIEMMARIEAMAAEADLAFENRRQGSGGGGPTAVGVKRPVASDRGSIVPAALPQVLKSYSDDQNSAEASCDDDGGRVGSLSDGSHRSHGTGAGLTEDSDDIDVTPEKLMGMAAEQERADSAWEAKRSREAAEISSPTTVSGGQHLPLSRSSSYPSFSSGGRFAAVAVPLPFSKDGRGRIIGKESRGLDKGGVDGRLVRRAVSANPFEMPVTRRTPAVDPSRVSDEGGDGSDGTSHESTVDSAAASKTGDVSMRGASLIIEEFEPTTTVDSGDNTRIDAIVSDVVSPFGSPESGGKAPEPGKEDSAGSDQVAIEVHDKSAQDEVGSVETEEMCMGEVSMAAQPSAIPSTEVVAAAAATTDSQAYQSAQEENRSVSTEVSSTSTEEGAQGDFIDIEELTLKSYSDGQNSAEASCGDDGGRARSLLGGSHRLHGTGASMTQVSDDINVTPEKVRDLAAEQERADSPAGAAPSRVSDTGRDGSDGTSHESTVGSEAELDCSEGSSLTREESAPAGPASTLKGRSSGESSKKLSGDEQQGSAGDEQGSVSSSREALGDPAADSTADSGNSPGSDAIEVHDEGAQEEIGSVATEENYMGEVSSIMAAQPSAMKSTEGVAAVATTESQACQSEENRSVSTEVSSASTAEGAQGDVDAAAVRTLDDGSPSSVPNGRAQLDGYDEQHDEDDEVEIAIWFNDDAKSHVSALASPRATPVEEVLTGHGISGLDGADVSEVGSGGESFAEKLAGDEHDSAGSSDIAAEPSVTRSTEVVVAATTDSQACQPSQRRHSTGSLGGSPRRKVGEIKFDSPRRISLDDIHRNSNSLSQSVPSFRSEETMVQSLLIYPPIEVDDEDGICSVNSLIEKSPTLEWVQKNIAQEGTSVEYVRRDSPPVPTTFDISYKDASGHASDSVDEELGVTAAVEVSRSRRSDDAIVDQRSDCENGGPVILAASNTAPWWKCTGRSRKCTLAAFALFLVAIVSGGVAGAMLSKRSPKEPDVVAAIESTASPSSSASQAPTTTASGIFTAKPSRPAVLTSAPSHVLGRSKTTPIR